MTEEADQHYSGTNNLAESEGISRSLKTDRLLLEMSRSWGKLDVRIGASGAHCGKICQTATHTGSWQMSNEELVKSQFSDVLKWIYVVLFLFDFSGLSPSTGSEATAQNIKEVREWCTMCDCAMIHAITGSFLTQDHILGCQQPHANQSVNAYFFTKDLWLPGGSLTPL